MDNAPPPPGPQEAFTPPFISLLFAVLLGYASYWLLTGVLGGLEWAPFLSLIIGGYAVMQVIKALNDWYRLLDHRKRVGVFEKAGKEHRPARFGTTKDLDNSEDFL